MTECWVVYDKRGHVPVIAGRTYEEALEKIEYVNADLRHHYYVRRFAEVFDVVPTMKQSGALAMALDAASRWAKLTEDPALVESIEALTKYHARIEALTESTATFSVPEVVPRPKPY